MLELLVYVVQERITRHDPLPEGIHDRDGRTGPIYASPRMTRSEIQKRNQDVHMITAAGRITFEYLFGSSSIIVMHGLLSPCSTPSFIVEVGLPGLHALLGDQVESDWNLTSDTE